MLPFWTTRPLHKLHQYRAFLSTSAGGSVELLKSQVHIFSLSTLYSYYLGLVAMAGSPGKAPSKPWNKDRNECPRSKITQGVLLWLPPTVPETGPGVYSVPGKEAPPVKMFGHPILVISRPRERPNKIHFLSVRLSKRRYFADLADLSVNVR
jgi:hypothetical protein